MAYFFDLEDFNTTCRAVGDQLLKSMNQDNLANQYAYYQKYGTYDGYKPSQETVVLNSDGTINFFVGGERGKTPIEYGGFCCKNKLPYIMQQANSKIGLFEGVDTTAIYWDAEKQFCRWKQEPETCVLDSFKIVLNPVENDGAIFNVGDNDKDCSLEIDFDYLFKMDCQNLADILNPSISSDPKLTSEILNLQNKIAEVNVSCSQISSQIDIKSKEFLSSNYSIVSCPPYVPYPTWVGYGNFDNLTSPFAYGQRAANLYGRTWVETNITYCINEENGGLVQWENILGVSRYKRFIDGNADSYTCDDVTAIAAINDNLIKTNQPPILTECTTPFGYKSNLKTEIDVLIEKQAKCNATLVALEAELNLLNSKVEVPSTCTTPLEVLESLDVSIILDVVNSDGTLSTVFENQLFETIGSGNLYEYLKEHPYNSGFYLCGVGTGDEAFMSGCTVLRYNDEVTGPTAPFSFNCGDVDLPADFHCNVTSCRIVKDSLLKSLYNESGLSNSTNDINAFKASLSKDIFASKWLNTTTTIDDAEILAKIKNKKIKLSLKINNTCANVCVYIDNIKLNRSCIDGNGKTVLISQSPGFHLERIIDNKKSWIKNSTRVNREFDISNNSGQNTIRQTDYDVNDERLVINTKEIDLDINIASAIENDVQCFINDNINLLDSIPSNGCGCSESLPCYEDVFDIITYEDALISGLIPAPIDPEDLLTKSRAVRDAWLKAWNEYMLATPPYLDLKNGVYNETISEYTTTVYKSTRDAWRKAIHEFNLASAGGFIEGLTIEDELLSVDARDAYVRKTFSSKEKLAPQMFHTACGRILKFLTNDGYMYFVETPSKELKVYWANTTFAPRNKTWIDITSFVQKDGGAYGGLIPVYTPEKASYFCKFLQPINYTTWVQMMSYEYQTNNNTSHNEWVNPVEDSFYVEWDSAKGKCMTNKFSQVIPEQFSMHYPITSLNFWTNYGDNALSESPQCTVDVYLRNSGTTACTSTDFTWPTIAGDIMTLNRAYRNNIVKLSNETKLSERTPLSYLYIIDPNTNMVPDETSGYIPVKVTTTIRKDSNYGDIVFKEEYVLNDDTSPCGFRFPSGDGLSKLRVYVGITDPNCTYWDVNTSQWDYTTQCTGSTEAGTYITGSTSTLPLAGASANGVDRNWSFDENYYVHFDVVNNNTNEVYFVTNNDYNLKDRTLPIVCPSSASTETFSISAALETINTFKTTILGQIQEDLDNALSECVDC